MKIYRLLPDTHGSWGRYEDFEARIATFAEKYVPDTPRYWLTQDLRERWIKERGILTGYWIVYGDAGVSCGHLCAYLNWHYQTPFIYFDQIEFDPGESVLTVMHQVAAEIGEWVKALNALFAAKGQPQFKITHGKSASWIEPRIYERLFKNLGFTPKAAHTVYKWSFEQEQ